MKRKNIIAEFEKELQSKYFNVLGKESTIDLHFESFNNLIDPVVSSKEVVQLNETLFNQFESVFNMIPSKSNVSFNIYFKDNSGYSDLEIKNIIDENIKLYIYSMLIENMKRNRTSLIMLVSGAIFLLLSYFLIKSNVPGIITDIINISGTLLIWEAAYMYLIEKTSNRKLITKYVRKIDKISIMKEE